MRRLMQEVESGAVFLARGRTGDNAGVLPTAYYAAMLEQFDGQIAGGRNWKVNCWRKPKGLCGTGPCSNAAAWLPLPRRECASWSASIHLLQQGEMNVVSWSAR